MTFRDGADLFTDRSFRICGSVWGRQACRPFSTRAHLWRLSPQRALTRGGSPPDARSLAATLPQRALTRGEAPASYALLGSMVAGEFAGEDNDLKPEHLNWRTHRRPSRRKSTREPDPRNCADSDALRRGGADGTGNAGTQAGSGGPVPASYALRSPQGADPAMTQQPWKFGDPAHNGGLPRFDPVSMQQLRDSDIRPSHCPP